MESSIKSSHFTISKHSIIRISLGVLLMFCSSQVQIPLEPVPITLQTAGMLIIALTYRRLEAIIAYSSYLMLGALGMPMFSELSGGIKHLYGNTAGYLFGMLFCIYLVTTLRQKFGEKTYSHLLAYSIAGSISVFIFGVSWLAYSIGFENAIKFGLLPFIVPGFIKALFVTSTVRLLKQKTWTSKK